MERGDRRPPTTCRRVVTERWQNRRRTWNLLNCSPTTLPATDTGDETRPALFGLLGSHGATEPQRFRRHSGRNTNPPAIAFNRGSARSTICPSGKSSRPKAPVKSDGSLDGKSAVCIFILCVLRASVCVFRSLVGNAPLLRQCFMKQRFHLERSLVRSWRSVRRLRDFVALAFYW